MVTIERRLGVNPTDFRLWVCLHEQTHRLQFAHAPWLRAHLMIREMAALLLDDDECGGAAARRASSAPWSTSCPPRTSSAAFDAG